MSVKDCSFALVAFLVFVRLIAPSTVAAEFAAGVPLGIVTDDRISEASGLVASRRNPGVLWTHNDGARDQLFAISTNGQLLAIWQVNENITDFEEIAIGPGPLPETSYLYIGDIGDNNSIRENVRVYRVPEPAVYDYLAENPFADSFPNPERVTLAYPDGARDAEAMFVDPVSGDLFIATKQTNVARIYRAPAAELIDDTTVTLQFVGEIGFHQAAAADISANGREIILRQENFARLWSRSPDQSVGDALTNAPFDIPVIGRPAEPNGEGIAFDPGGFGYFTFSEGLSQPVYFFARTSGEVQPRRITLIAPASEWRVLDDGTDQGTAWRTNDFDDIFWSTGRGQFGYGQGDEQRVIEFGNDDAKYITTYFRTEFQVDDPAVLQNVVLSAVFDDGVAIYINGREAVRQNLAGDAGYLTPAASSGSALENIWQSFSVSASTLRAGANTIAVEVHRRSGSENDLSFDLQLTAHVLAPAPILRFGVPQKLPDGALVLAAEGPPNTTATLQAASDFQNWTNVASLPLENGRALFTNAAPNASQLFYRLRLP